MLQDITFEANLGLDILSEDFIVNIEAIIELATEQSRHSIANLAGDILDAVTESEKGYPYKARLDSLYTLTMHRSNNDQWNSSMELSERVKRVGAVLQILKRTQGMKIYNSKAVLNRALTLWPEAAPYIHHIDDLREVLSETAAAAWMTFNKPAGPGVETVLAHEFIIEYFNGCEPCEGTGGNWSGSPIDPSSDYDECRNCNGSGKGLDDEDLLSLYVNGVYEIGSDWCDNREE